MIKNTFLSGGGATQFIFDSLEDFQTWQSQIIDNSTSEDLHKYEALLQYFRETYFPTGLQYVQFPCEFVIDTRGNPVLLKKNDEENF